MKTNTKKIDICGNWRAGGPEREFAGNGTVDQYGAIECAADLGDEAYDAIEDQIADGHTKGSVTVHDAAQDRDITYHWSLSLNDIIDCGGKYEVHPGANGGWCVVNSETGQVRSSYASQADAVAAAEALNDDDE